MKATRSSIASPAVRSPSIQSDVRWSTSPKETSARAGSSTMAWSSSPTWCSTVTIVEGGSRSATLARIAEE